jgi:hypothetical protein
MDAVQGGGEGRGLATDTAEQVVIALEVAASAATAEPTGGRLTSYRNSGQVQIPKCDSSNEMCN